MFDDEAVGADTAAFQAFQDASEYRPERRTGFRVMTLLMGLAALAAIAWLLLQ